MCDGEDGAVSKLCADGLLNEVVGLEVHGSSGFVQDQDLGLAEQSSSQAHQLTLTHTGKSQRNKISNYLYRGTTRNTKNPQINVLQFCSTCYIIIICTHMIGGNLSSWCKGHKLLHNHNGRTGSTGAKGEQSALYSRLCGRPSHTHTSSAQWAGYKASEWHAIPFFSLPNQFLILKTCQALHKPKVTTQQYRIVSRI